MSSNKLLVLDRIREGRRKSSEDSNIESIMKQGRFGSISDNTQNPPQNKSVCLTESDKRTICDALMLIRRVEKTTVEKLNSKKNSNIIQTADVTTLKRPRRPPLPLMQQEPVVMRSIDDIYKEAQSNFFAVAAKYKDKKEKKYLGKLDPNARKFGIPKIISPELIREIKEDLGKQVHGRNLHQARIDGTEVHSIRNKVNFEGRPNTAPAVIQRKSTEKSLRAHMRPDILTLDFIDTRLAKHLASKHSDSSVVSSNSASARSYLERGMSTSPSMLQQRSQDALERRQQRATEDEEYARELEAHILAKEETAEEIVAASRLSVKVRAEELATKRAMLLAVKQSVFVRHLIRAALVLRRRLNAVFLRMFVFMFVVRVRRWYLRSRVRGILRRQPWVVDPLLRARLLCWRRCQTRKRQQGGALIARFFNDVRSMGEKLLALHTFRLKVIKVQRWCRSFVRCQRARLQLLWLAFEVLEKEVHSVSIHVRIRTENKSRRNLMSTRSFGQTVSRIERVNGQVSMLLQKHKRINKLVARISDHSWSPKNWFERLKQSKNGPRKMQILRDFLSVQRRRHMVERANTIKYNAMPKVKTVDIRDVKHFLATPGYKALVVPKERTGKKTNRLDPFLLFNGGLAMDELRSIAISLSRDSTYQYSPDSDSLDFSGDAHT